tara:strand:+ start:2907 stop:3818 length:912 start_codon:yes stop_codon:yes gene_type:complete
MSESIKFIDLFAGIGGFHLAFHKIGAECVFASEIDDIARKVYEENFSKLSPKIFPHNFNRDIYDLNTNDLPDFDILCGGFPCQPFSQIGQRRGFKENFEGRGNLFFEIARIINDKKPKAFFLENVQHIVKHDNGKTFKIIQNTIRDLDYSFYYKKIRACDFGLPQLRPRIFMIGFRDEKISDEYYKFPEPIQLKKTMSDIFKGNCSRDIGFTLRLGGMGSKINDRRNWDSYLVDNKVVKLQKEHALQMQGFPKNFKLPKSRSQSLKLLGNSVAVNAIHAVAKQLIKYIDDKDSFRKGSQRKFF